MPLNRQNGTRFKAYNFEGMKISQLLPYKGGGYVNCCFLEIPMRLDKPVSIAETCIFHQVIETHLQRINY
jgi:hypothetical protein